MDQQPILKSGLITLLAGMSATAAFAATGFIAEFGRDQLLGINLSDWSVQRLTLLAGRCAADSFFLVLNLLERHWNLVTVCVVAAGAGMVLLRHRKLPAWAAPAAECALAVPLLIWLLMSITNFEGPTVPLRGWIMAPNGQSPLSTAIRQLHPTVSASSVAAGSRDYVKSAVTATAASPGVTRLSEYYYGNRSDGPGALLLESSSDEVGQQLKAIGFTYHARDAARNLLYNGYARVVTVCILALLYILLSRQSPESKLWGDLLTVVRVAVIITSGVATVLLPYVYGKLVDSTLFSNCHIAYTDPTAKTNPQGGEFPVISQTDTSLSLLWIQSGGGHTQIIQIPRDKVLSLEFESDVDALAKISKCIEQPGSECQ